MKLLEYSKAFVALASLIITGIAASNIVPVTGTTHNVWVIVVIVVGAFATWLTPNKAASSAN